MEEKRVPISGARKYIGDVMLHSVTAYPQARGFIQVDMGEILALKDAFMDEGQKIAMSAFMIKLIGTAMKDFPELNARIEKNEIVYYTDINCGIGVDVGTGLLVPVIKNVDQKSVLEISNEFKAMVKKITSKTMTLDDMKEATFTLTNFSQSKPEAFTSIITNDQCIIAGIGGIKKQVVVGDNDELLIRPMCTVILNMNHTITDGKSVHAMMERIYDICLNPKEYFL